MSLAVGNGAHGLPHTRGDNSREKRATAPSARFPIYILDVICRGGNVGSPLNYVCSNAVDT